MFADAFTLQLVEFEDLQNCNYVLGMIPTLQKFAKDVSSCRHNWWRAHWLKAPIETHRSRTYTRK